MTQPAGFGKPKQSVKKAPTQSAQQRAESEKRYEEMKADGVEYEVFLRLKGKEQWLPMGGGIVVQRSDQIHKAIYANEQELTKTAYHRLPALKKSKVPVELEYGFRLKGEKDDEIEVAVRPVPLVPSPIQNAFANAGKAIGGLFQKKA
jgi:hypothetical protein